MTEAAPAPAPDEEGWQRLDVRMLLLDPFKVLRQFLVPAAHRPHRGAQQQRRLAAVDAAARRSSAPIVFGSLPWLTTRFRITDYAVPAAHRAAEQEAADGAPRPDPQRRPRVVAAPPALGLSKVEIGTGVDDSRITLDSLAVPQADDLRARPARPTCGRLAAAPPRDAPDQPSDAPARPSRARPVEVLARIDWSWLRFAPFSLSRLAVVAGAIGVLCQFGDSLPFLDADSLEHGWNWVLGFALPLVVSGRPRRRPDASGRSSRCPGYVVQWWSFVLARERGHLRLTAGLFTTRSTTVEEARIRGVELSEPVLLRLVGGGELSTLATGVGEGGVTTVLPPCPVEVATGVGRTLLGEDGAPSMDLVAHGAARPASLPRPRAVAHPGPHGRRRGRGRRLLDLRSGCPSLSSSASALWAC